MTIEVQAPSRLHFGLFSLGEETCWPNHSGQPAIPARRFGGVGLMVREPRVIVSVTPADSWSANPPLAQRALDYAFRLAATFPPDKLQPQQIKIQTAAEHVGLGTGTQLALALGRALAVSWGFPQLDVLELARRLGRGERSALGTHGFSKGGFLVEAGKSTATGLAPLVARADFPADWRIVLLVPRWAIGLHGSREQQAFQQVSAQQSDLATTDVLCRLTLLGMLPALAERDLPAFGEALHDFNLRVGELFAGVQGGPYAHARLAELVSYIRQQGVRGVGQSSWGATIFAVVGSDEEAADLSCKVHERFELAEDEVFCTSADNQGHRLHVSEEWGS